MASSPIVLSHNGVSSSSTLPSIVALTWQLVTGLQATIQHAALGLRPCPPRTSAYPTLVTSQPHMGATALTSCMLAEGVQEGGSWLGGMPSPLHGAGPMPPSSVWKILPVPDGSQHLLEWQQGHVNIVITEGRPTGGVVAGQVVVLGVSSPVGGVVLAGVACILGSGCLLAPQHRQAYWTRILCFELDQSRRKTASTCSTEYMRGSKICSDNQMDLFAIVGPGLAGFILGARCAALTGAT